MEEVSRQKQTHYDDEISLVDLASTFLKRRRIFYIVFLSVLLAGIVSAVVMPDKYDYVSVIKLAEKQGGKYIKEPEAMIATLENRWLPEYHSIYHAEHDRAMPFKVVFTNPESTGLVRLVSEATRSQQEEVKRLHGQLIEGVEQIQSVAVSNLKQNLERQIESLSSTIDMLEGTRDAGAAIAAAVERQLSLESDLASIEPMTTLAVSRESVTRNGPARSLIVVLAGLLGLMAGVFSAFFAEFVAAVKVQMSEM